MNAIVSRTGALMRCAAVVLLWLGTAAPIQAQVSSEAPIAPANTASPEAPESAAVGDEITETEGRMSTAVEIALLLTVLSLLPAILISLTSFTRIVIVLSFVRRAMAVNELPPNPVMIGLALFLTTFVMGPVLKRTYDASYAPYQAGEIELTTAAEAAWDELSGFLVTNTRESELQLFRDMASKDMDDAEREEFLGGESLPLRVVVPAFILSELKTAFQMGFLLFLPFLVIDLVISSVLLSMGMFMLPPVMISTPFKILLFVLVDGWRLVCESLVTSFVVA